MSGVKTRPGPRVHVRATHGEPSPAGHQPAPGRGVQDTGPDLETRDQSYGL